MARIVGFEAIPETDAAVAQSFRRLPEARAAEGVLLEALAARGYQEAITLAFVDPALQRRLFPEQPGLALANPIASDLSRDARVAVAGAVTRGARESASSAGPGPAL